MITAKTKIDLSLFNVPISLVSKSTDSTIFEGYSNFENGKFSPDLDAAIKSICNALGIETFLKTEVKLDEIYGHFNWTENRLFVQGVIPLEYSNAIITLNYQPSKTNSKQYDFAVILDFQFFFDLSHLPFIQHELDDSLHLTLAFANNNQVFQTISFEESTHFNHRQKISVNSGIALKTNLKLPSDTFEFDYELQDFSSQPPTQSDLKNNLENLSTLPEEKNTKWFDINKNIGRLNFRKLGMRWQQNKVWLLLNMDFVSSGLEFTIIGLQAGSSLDLKSFQPKFDLEGIGVYFKNNFLEIGGSLLKAKAGDSFYKSYIGKVLLRFSNFNIGAVGGFSSSQEGEKSFFAFANLNMPLGGTPAFFINGLSVGFGYNSSLNLPKTSQINNYPLLKIIETGEQNHAQALEYLRNIVQAKTQEKWLAAGVQFTSFQLINSNVILAYQFEKKEVIILGLSKIVLPNEKMAYLNLQFGLKSTYKISSGEIQSNAMLLDGSFLIHKNVNISGSVALYAWLNGEHQGDFVLTVGGYHPRFEKPQHYPTVPKVGFSWLVSDAIQITGNTYFALTNQAIMTGLSLEAYYQKGNLKAWFSASSDMILQWKPFYYDISTKTQLTINYQSNGLKNYKIDVSANLQLYGPEMGGYLHINWSIISFNIRFGNPEKARFIYVLDWEMFRHSFLPMQNSEICQIRINKGLADEKSGTDNKKIWITYSNDLSFSTQSLIPSNGLFLNHKKIDFTCDMLGIRPMNKQQLQSTQSITIRDKNNNIIDVNTVQQPVITQFSPALWAAKPLNRQELKTETLRATAGLNFSFTSTKKGSLAKTNIKVFEHEKIEVHCKFEHQTNSITTTITKGNNTINTIVNSINNQTTHQKRGAIINEMNNLLDLPQDERLPNEQLVKIEKNAESIFQSEPQIGQIKSVESIAAIPSMLIQKVQEAAVRTEIGSFKPTIIATATQARFNSIDWNKDLISKGLKPTSKDTNIIINIGAAFVFDLDCESDFSDKIEFESNCFVQVIEFNAFNQILGFEILPASSTSYSANKQAKRLAIKGIELKTEFDGWKSTDILPLINDNALLGNQFYTKLQVPIANESRTHRSIKLLEKTNYINTIQGEKKGYIDTTFFKYYQEIVVITNTKDQVKKEQLENIIKLSIPCSFEQDFNRQLHQSTYFKPVSQAIDTDGNMRLKYRLSQHKVGITNRNKNNWNGFTLRIETTADTEILELRLYHNSVKKEQWTK